MTISKKADVENYLAPRSRKNLLPFRSSKPAAPARASSAPAATVIPIKHKAADTLKKPGDSPSFRSPRS